MFLADAYEDILQRKADEAPAGEFPIQTVWTFPGYDPAKEASYQPAPVGAKPQQVVITAPRPDAWDQILTNRAAMVVQAPARRAFDPLPWILAAAGLAAAALLLNRKKTGERKAPTARRKEH